LDHEFYVNNKDVRSKTKKLQIVVDQDYINPITKNRLKVKKIDHSKRFVTVRPSIERMMEEDKRKSIVSQPESDHVHHFCCSCSSKLTL
jgi:hypothetical protein